MPRQEYHETSSLLPSAFARGGREKQEDEIWHGLRCDQGTRSLQAMMSSSPSSSAGRAELANKANLKQNGVQERDAMTGGVMKVMRKLGLLFVPREWGIDMLQGPRE